MKQAQLIDKLESGAQIDVCTLKVDEQGYILPNGQTRTRYTLENAGTMPEPLLTKRQFDALLRKNAIKHDHGYELSGGYIKHAIYVAA